MFLPYHVLLPDWRSLQQAKPHACWGHLCKVWDAEGLAVTRLPASTYPALSPGPLSSEGSLPLPRPTRRGYFGGSGFLGLRKNPEWP